MSGKSLSSHDVDCRSIADSFLSISRNQMSVQRQQSLSTSVARLYLTSAETDHGEWREKMSGAVCFVRDSNRRSYYIMVSRQASWMLPTEKRIFFNF